MPKVILIGICFPMANSVYKYPCITIMTYKKIKPTLSYKLVKKLFHSKCLFHKEYINLQKEKDYRASINKKTVEMIGFLVGENRP